MWGPRITIRDASNGRYASPGFNNQADPEASRVEYIDPANGLTMGLGASAMEVLNERRVPSIATIVHLQ